MMLNEINKISYFIKRDLCEHLYVSLYHSDRSQTKLVYKNDTKNKIYNNQIDFNFFENLPSLTYSLLLRNKALLYFDIKSDAQNNKEISFHAIRTKYSIKRKGIIVNDIKIPQKDLCKYIIIKLSKEIKSKKIKKSFDTLAKINTMATNDVSLIQSIPVDIKGYEEQINLFALKETKELGGLIGYDQERLNLTGYYAYVRELKKQILQYELFFNIIDEINKHFIKFSKEIDMDIELSTDKCQYNELKETLSKMKDHKIDLLKVSDILYKR